MGYPEPIICYLFKTMRQSVHHIRQGWDIFSKHITFEVGYGNNVWFWQGWWCGQKPLREAFPRLFILAQKKDALVADCFSWHADCPQWYITFHRALQDWKLDVMMDFLELLYSIKIQRNSEDVIWWTPTCSRVFEVKSSFKELSIRGSMSFPWKSIWNAKLPTKVAFFVWTAALGNILTVDNLRRHHIIIVDWCCMCKQWGISGSLITSL